MSLKYAILGLLKEKPMYGYEIKQKFEKSFGEIWPVSYGQLYPTLKSLTELKYVTLKIEKGQKSHEKNVYKISDLGIHFFDEWMEKDNKKSHFSIKDNFTLSLFFATQKNDATLLKQAEVLIFRLDNEILIYKDKLKLNNKSLNIYQVMIIEKMLLHLEVEKEWLMKLINKLQ